MKKKLTKLSMTAAVATVLISSAPAYAGFGEGDQLWCVRFKGYTICIPI
jgi:hypothetical protein